MQLTNGTGASDGILEVLYQREWYTICSYYYYYSNNNDGSVVCKELGYDGGVVVSDNRQQTTSEYMYTYHLWPYLYCEGSEDSIYDCINYYEEFSYSYCSYIAEYSCQSMFTTIVY